jgi:NADH-quinone oxidoreductase subunit G
MITITIDGKSYSVEPQGNLLETCLSLGIDIPYFCFHPALGSVGSCRLCAVKRFRDANDKKGRIVMSCMEPVIDGMQVSVEDDEVKEFRSSVIESLMTNHPHDCPVCDEGGECHLQDMVVMTGHNYRRYEFKKRTYKNQYLGPHINHEMNRCIQCYRCVRYYKDYAGGTDFGVFGTNNHLYFGRFQDGALESEFSGNLIEVCPTGVFTDKLLKKHYTRKWDLTNAPSICTQCSVGCNTIVGERYGQIRRTLNRYNNAVNGYFLCDRGRFGYEFVNAETRIRQSIFQADKSSAPNVLTSDEAIRKSVEVLSKGKTMGIGSPVASLEANYALQKLTGKDNYYAGISAHEFALIHEIRKIYASGSIHVPTLREIEKSEAVIILGEDILKTAPRIALSVRQAVKNKPMAIATQLNIQSWNAASVKTAVGKAKGPLFIATPEATRIDDMATATYRKEASSIARLGQSIAEAIGGNTSNVPAEDKSLVQQIVSAIQGCKSVMVISGTQLGNKDVIDASAKLAQAISSLGVSSGLYCVVPECNSLGLSMITENHLEQALDTLQKGSFENIIILENNLYNRFEKEKINAALTTVKNVIVLDHSQSELSDKANLVLASGTFAESEGTLINSEGRMQRYFSAMPAKEGIHQSWKWLSDIQSALTHGEKATFDTLVKEISVANSSLTKITEVAPDSEYREGGMRIPRQTQRFSGRTSILAHVAVSEPKPTPDENSPLIYSMEGSKSLHDNALNSFYWAPGWNSVQASNKYLKELNNALKGRNPGIRLFQ